MSAASSSDAAAAPGGPSTGLSRPAMVRGKRRGTSLFARGEPMLWLTGGGLALSLVMVVGLVALVIWQGVATLWPVPVIQVRRVDGTVLMGEVTRSEKYRPADSVFESLPRDLAGTIRERVRANGGEVERRLLRTGNYDLTQTHFHWVSSFEISQETSPEWALVIERLSWGRFYGNPKAFLVDGKPVATTPSEVWSKFEEFHEAARERWQRRRRLEIVDIGEVNRKLEAARLDVRAAELASGNGSPTHTAASESYSAIELVANEEFAKIQEQIAALNQSNDRYQLLLSTAGGQEKSIGLAEIVRCYPANQLSWTQRLAVYLSRWGEFLLDDPREANSEGGVFPAIWGTVAMTLLMTMVVLPFGVLAALYLREYAGNGWIVSAVRIAINNLAGVPSIVFGVFGLGFFCYYVGAGIDETFFAAHLPNPTFGKGGLVWASLTLALLTLPVVIVATEEALAAVPRSMREGSYACGASKWQTIWRIVLPRALPGIMTGAILAMARGAGEVAPLMLVGAVKLAPELPVDWEAPFIHGQRSFMHLGFHIYDLGFQSQNSEAAKPMVYTTTLLLIVVIALMNIIAVALRSRLRRRFAGDQF